MRPLMRLVTSALSFAVISISLGPADADARVFPCYACALDCGVGGGSLACADECHGMQAQYCVGPDIYGYCDHPYRDTIIECAPNET